MMRALVILTTMGLLYIYLFVTAPPPLPDRQTNSANREISASELFSLANLINAEARKIYTSRIVSKGLGAGLKFDEAWLDPGVEAGPLPALFLRLTAKKLRDANAELGLFLGSSNPINRSNRFTGEQVSAFARLITTLKPQYFQMETLRLNVGMYPDLASAAGCVSCHNDHPRSPKKDWRMNDVMGATTWTYPRSLLSSAESTTEVAKLYGAIRAAYGEYLIRAARFTPPVPVGQEWPQKGERRLPDANTFMRALFEVTGAEVARIVLVDFGNKR
jgi:adenylate cyclase